MFSCVVACSYSCSCPVAARDRIYVPVPVPVPDHPVSVPVPAHPVRRLEYGEWRMDWRLEKGGWGMKTEV